MNKKISILSISYTVFLLVLLLSGSISGVGSSLVYYLAFIICFLIPIWNTREESKNDLNLFKIDKSGWNITFVTLFPALLLILLLSFVTSYIINLLTGATNSVVLGDSLVLAVISHALVPAILEEMLFRYVPIRLISSHSKRVTVLVSAIFFALVHHSLFSIPYAFVAGVIFMLVDLACVSVLPSMILHFANNLLSVLLIFYADYTFLMPICAISLGVCSIVSVAVILFGKNDIGRKICEGFAKGERIKISPTFLTFVVISMTIAVLSFV